MSSTLSSARHYETGMVKQLIEQARLIPSAEALMTLVEMWTYIQGLIMR